MKKAVIYSMLVFYIAVQLKPLTIIIQDVLAHTFWKVQHMATEHHHHGHHHVHEELANDELHDHTSPAEKSTTQKLSEEFSIHLLEPFNFQFKNRSINTQYFSNLTSNLETGFFSVTSPPPKA